MGQVLPEISEKEASFIASQKVFFVATAPLSVDHHVSVSPKANGCVVLDPHTVVYADLTGSGAETAAHVLQNGRMTLMFCNIEAGPPKILRLFGRADVILAENVPTALLKKLPVEITSSHGFRAVYKLHVHRISSSCGYSMPIMEFKKNRSTLDDITEKEGKVGIFNYNTLKNSFSIDGLPSLALLRKDAPNVEPVAEEGFILGKVQGKASCESDVTRDFKLKVYHAPATVRLRVSHLVLAGLSIFVAGLVVGVFVQQHSKLS
jgi:Pyridoxamine 5'-phosphate oxidase